MTAGSPPPEFEGVTHRYIGVSPGVTIHVADAGPEGGPPVMLVHGFPQNWWAGRALIGPLAADGYRVLCPDLRGAGWSSAPDARYRKADLAEDLATVLTRLGVGPVKVVADDWGGPVALILLLRHPSKVTGFLGLNTTGPGLPVDWLTVRDAWRFWYQLPMAPPVLGPRILADPKGRWLRRLCRWLGAGFELDESAYRLYIERMSDKARAVAGSRWYRTFQTRELVTWARNGYSGSGVGVPVRWLSGADDPVITPNLMRGYRERLVDFDIEFVPGVGHWIVEQRPDLVLERTRALLKLPPGR